MMNQKSASHKPLIFLSFVVFVSLITLVVYVIMPTLADRAKKDRIKQHQDAYTASLRTENAATLRNLFEEDVSNGVNDEFTRSAAFWIMHRYFDNGGNVYEIYDFINAHPSLAFLNTEAEQLRPVHFRWLKEGTIPKSYSTRSKYVLMAYLEVLDNHGYGNVASRGMMAHQYAFEAYYSRRVPEDFPKSFDHETFQKEALEKSAFFLKKMNDDVADIVDGKLTEANMPPRDILLGADQYAASIRYLARQNVHIPDLKKTPEEAFAFATPYAKRYVPELYLFTTYLNASSCIVDQVGCDKKTIEQILYPFYTFAIPKEQRNPTNIVDRILNSRVQTYNSVDLYGKTNAQWLASESPKYQAWLIANGWTEEDFK